MHPEPSCVVGIFQHSVWVMKGIWNSWPPMMQQWWWVQQLLHRRIATQKQHKGGWQGLWQWILLLPMWSSHSRRHMYRCWMMMGVAVIQLEIHLYPQYAKKSDPLEGMLQQATAVGKMNRSCSPLGLCGTRSWISMSLTAAQRLIQDSKDNQHEYVFSLPPLTHTKGFDGNKLWILD